MNCTTDPAWPTWGAALHAGISMLSAASPTPELDAAVLLSHVTGATRAQLLAFPERILNPGDQRRYRELVARRATGEPVAYLTAHREFMGLDFATDRRALIPRPETELLVEAARDAARAMAARGIAPVVADVGTGSGAIALSLAALEPHVARVYALDVSADALSLARENAARLGVADRVVLLQGDLLDPLPEPVDLLLANLPYVSQAEASALPRDVREFEPATALFGEDDGLGHVRRLFGSAARHLRAGACLMLEIGADQGAAVRALARQAFPDATLDVRKDLAGLDRLVIVCPAQRSAQS